MDKVTLIYASGYPEHQIPADEYLDYVSNKLGYVFGDTTIYEDGLHVTKLYDAQNNLAAFAVWQGGVSNGI